jgi:hypothetical protein
VISANSLLTPWAMRANDYPSLVCESGECTEESKIICSGCLLTHCGDEKCDDSCWSHYCVQPTKIDVCVACCDHAIDCDMLHCTHVCQTCGKPVSNVGEGESAKANKHLHRHSHTFVPLPQEDSEEYADMTERVDAFLKRLAESREKAGQETKRQRTN